MCTLVEVESDDGVIGFGTAGAFHGRAKSLIEDYYSELLIGDDPRRHEYLWQRMYRTTVRFGRSGSAMTAISALDVACWELHGKSEDKPVYDLIGGQAQTTVPCYLSRLYALEDLQELADEARHWKALGFSRMKQRFGFGSKDGRVGMKRNADLVRTVRDAVGDGVELAADAYMGWDIGYAIEMTTMLCDFNLSWTEEPLMPHEMDGYAELKRRCFWQRWSCGEHLFGKWEFKPLIGKCGADILQPYTNRAGGITEVLKVCAMPAAAGLRLIPHSNEAHNLHVIFGRLLSVCPRVEYFSDLEPDTGNELFWKLFSGLPEAENGSLSIGHAPGLGTEIVRAR